MEKSKPAKEEKLTGAVTYRFDNSDLLKRIDTKLKQPFNLNKDMWRIVQYLVQMQEIMVNSQLQTNNLIIILNEHLVNASSLLVNILKTEMGTAKASHSTQYIFEELRTQLMEAQKQLLDQQEQLEGHKPIISHLKDAIDKKKTEMEGLK